MVILKDMIQITSFVEWTIKYLKYLLLGGLTFFEYINSNIFIYIRKIILYIYSAPIQTKNSQTIFKYGNIKIYDAD